MKRTKTPKLFESAPRDFWAIAPKLSPEHAALFPKLDEIADVVLAHKPKPKAKAARKRVRRAKRHAQAHES